MGVRSVSPEFRKKVVEIATRLKADPDHLMAIMEFESGLNPKAVNKVSNATGLIQWIPSTAAQYGLTKSKLLNMTAEQQLDYVEKYFSGYEGKLTSISDFYAKVNFPVAVGYSEDTIVYDSQGEAAKNFWKEPTDRQIGLVKMSYEWNKALDANGDGQITKRELAAKVQQRYDRGKANQLK